MDNKNVYLIEGLIVNNSTMIFALFMTISLATFFYGIPLLYALFVLVLLTLVIRYGISPALTKTFVLGDDDLFVNGTPYPYKDIDMVDVGGMYCVVSFHSSRKSLYFTIFEKEKKVIMRERLDNLISASVKGY